MSERSGRGVPPKSEPNYAQASAEQRARSYFHERVRTMSQANLVLLLLGGLTLVLSLGATLLQTRQYLPTETMLAVAVGVVAGPHGLGLLEVSDWGSPLLIIEEVARLTGAVAVTSHALLLPVGYFKNRARTMAILLGIGLPLMWLSSSLLASLALAVPLSTAVLLGAIVAPTDPVLASTIVKGQTAQENIPRRLRHLLSAEAGASPGGAFLFFSFGLFLLGGAGRGGPLEWAAGTLLWKLFGAVLLGALLGGLIGRLEAWLSAKRYLEEASLLTISVSLTFTALALGKLVGTVDILVAFVAGLAYNWQSNPQDEEREQKVEEVFNRLFTYPVFVLFGMVLPWAEWTQLGWGGVALAFGILLLRRFPMAVVLRPAIRPLDRRADMLFFGWFGPVGISTLYYGAHAARALGDQEPWIFGSLVVAASILAHGATSSLFTLEYGKSHDPEVWW